MRAAQMKERPSFALMKQTDIQSLYYMQMPRWLFSDPRYAEMSLEAKVTYTFLLNRFQLSRRKGWVNEYGEVFVIFPRKALAQELRVCEKRIIAAFHKLTELQLIWEKRCGRGDANQIYLARVDPVSDPSYECAPFHSEEYESVRSRPVNMAALAEAGTQDLQDWQVKDCENGRTRTAESAVPELPDPQQSNKDKKENMHRQKSVCHSVRRAPVHDRQTGDEDELADLLAACELDSFAPETASVFENAIERLYYADSFRIGNATLPQSRVRSRLRRLDGMVLREAEAKLNANLDHPVKNSTAYTMSTIFNCITEGVSDLMVDPYLNRLRSGRR